MNIILVVFDTLRKDCVGVYGEAPWGGVHVPNFQAFAAQSLVMTRAYPNVLPTLPARVALYSGRKVYPFERGDIRLKGDFVGAPGWGPIPEEWPTVAETLSEAGYRTGLISDVLHQFKPSKNFWRGFDQWTFLRGQENDPARSGPVPSLEEIERLWPGQLDAMRQFGDHPGRLDDDARRFIQSLALNARGREHETDYFSPRVFQAAVHWLEENRDAEKFFLMVESFDPHEPWLAAPHYRKLYMQEDRPQQVITFYGPVVGMADDMLRSTRANYRASVSQCDRWFGYFMETLRVLGRLDDTLVILTADHGHTIGEEEWMGKSGYPSRPEVFDNPLFIRYPGAEHAGRTCDHFVQHVDISATVLDAAGVQPAHPIDGVSFLKSALDGSPPRRDHVTIGWGSTPTVITEHWWFNCKADGTGVVLYDRTAAQPFARNVADEHRDVVDQLFRQALADAGGAFPQWIIDLSKSEADAPGCSQMAVRA